MSTPGREEPGNTILEQQVKHESEEKYDREGSEETKQEANIKVKEETDEILQASVGFESKWNIEHSNRELSHIRSQEDLTKNGLVQVLSNENNAETHRVTPQHDRCKIDAIDLSHLSSACVPHQEFSRHVSSSSLTEMKQNHEQGKLRS